jgi:hypothetical protein
MLLRLDVFSLRTLSSLVERNIEFPQGDIGRKRYQEWVRSQENEMGGVGKHVKMVQWKQG